MGGGQAAIKEVSNNIAVSKILSIVHSTEEVGLTFAIPGRSPREPIANLDLHTANMAIRQEIRCAMTWLLQQIGESSRKRYGGQLDNTLASALSSIAVVIFFTICICFTFLISRHSG